MAQATTAITTVQIDKMTNICGFRYKKLCLLTTVLLSHQAIAQQQGSGLTLNANTEASTVFQDFKSDRAGNKVDATTLQIEPTISLDYRSRRFQGRWTASHTHLQRDFDSENRTNNFTEYLYNARFVAIENLLTFQARGALNYQNVQSDGFLVNDFLLNSEELSKTRSNQFSLISNIPTGNYFGGNGSIAYSDTQSEARADSNQSNLDNNSYTMQGQLLSGDALQWLDWQVSGNFQNTERDVQNDFTSRNLNADVNVSLFSDLAFSLRAEHEANQLGGNGGLTDQTGEARNFNSFGAGISWRVSSSRFITLTYNTADSDIEDNEEDFLGVDFNWNFTSRTSVSGSYGRRFFGESGDFRFQHNTKSLRTQITYSEEVTSFSRLIADPENLGVFVCQEGNVDLTACFQPNTLNYQLLPGEQFIQFSTQNAEINDEVILRKGLNGQVGYEFGRLRVSLDARYALDEYLETDRIQRTYSAGLNSTLQIGSYTNVTARLNYAETEQRSTVVNSGSSETWEFNTGITRKIGQHLSTSIDFRFLDRSGTLTTGFGGQNLQDRRVSASIKYIY